MIMMTCVICRKMYQYLREPVKDRPVAIIVRSKALIYTLLNAEIVGWNPAEGTDVSFPFVMGCVGRDFSSG